MANKIININSKGTYPISAGYKAKYIERNIYRYLSASGMKLYLKMDSAGESNFVNDLHAPTYSGSISTVAGQVNNCYSFSNGMINFGNRYDPGTSDFTWAVWIKRNPAEALSNAFFEWIISKRYNSVATENGVALGIMAQTHGGGGPPYALRFYFVTEGANVSEGGYYGYLDLEATPTNIFDNTWHHVAVVVSRGTNGTIKYYRDGSLIHTYTIPYLGVLTCASDAPLSIGDNPNSHLQYLGQMDEVMMWHRALTADEIGYIANLTDSFDYVNISASHYYSIPMSNPVLDGVVINDEVTVENTGTAHDGNKYIISEVASDGIVIYNDNADLEDYTGGQGIVYINKKIVTDRWQITLTPIEKGFYGYGYGSSSSFVDPENPGSYEYFDVLGISGSTSGYGIENTITGPVGGSLFSGWGYELANSVVADGDDSIQIKATVTKNGIAQSGIRVIFQASPGVSFMHNSMITDSNGDAFADVRVDYSKFERLIQETQTESQSSQEMETILDQENVTIGLAKTFGVDYIYQLFVSSLTEGAEDVAVGDMVSINQDGLDPEQDLPEDFLAEENLEVTSIDDQFVNTSGYYIFYLRTENFNDSLSGGSIQTEVNIQIQREVTITTIVNDDNVSSFGTLPPSGIIQIKGIIDHRPRVDEGITSIQISSAQRFTSDAFKQIIINSYAFQVY